MFEPANAKKKATKVSEADTHTKNKTHERHLHYEECLAMGLSVHLIEEAKDASGQKDPVFQDLVLTVHHCDMHLLMTPPATRPSKTTGRRAVKNQNLAPGPFIVRYQANATRQPIPL